MTSVAATSSASISALYAQSVASAPKTDSVQSPPPQEAQENETAAQQAGESEASETRKRTGSVIDIMA